MSAHPARLIPLKAYILAGHGILLAVLLIIPLTMFAPFWSFKFGGEWRAAIPDWASLHGQEGVLLTVYAIAYPVCVGGALLTWAVNERNARVHVSQRRGMDARPTERKR